MLDLKHCSGIKHDLIKQMLCCSTSCCDKHQPKFFDERTVL